MRQPLLLLLAACSGSAGEDADTKDKPPIELTIVSPDEGGSYPRSEALDLEVSAMRGARAVEIAEASWTIGEWTGSGISTQATSLPEGAATVEVEALVEGETVTASVEVRMTADGGDADTDTDADTDADTDTDTGPDWSYSGTLNATVTVANTDGFELDDSCNAPITFTLTDGALAGAGSCLVFEDYTDEPLPFTMRGTLRGTTITGALVMTSDGTDYDTPFSGSGSAGDPLTATFDTTHSSPDGSLRIDGSWNATVP